MKGARTVIFTGGGYAEVRASLGLSLRNAPGAAEVLPHAVWAEIGLSLRKCAEANPRCSRPRTAHRSRASSGRCLRTLRGHLVLFQDKNVESGHVDPRFINFFGLQDRPMRVKLRAPSARARKFGPKFSWELGRGCGSCEPFWQLSLRKCCSAAEVHGRD